jgi:hypothetical protein
MKRNTNPLKTVKNIVLESGSANTIFCSPPKEFGRARFLGKVVAQNLP